MEKKDFSLYWQEVLFLPRPMQRNNAAKAVHGCAASKKEKSSLLNYAALCRGNKILERNTL